MRLLRLIYHSKAAEGCGYEEYDAIRTTANLYNAEANITGMLIFGRGRFLQMLEGGDRAVNALYNRIVTDPRHTEARIIEAVPVPRRAFPKWSMKAVIMDDHPENAVNGIVLRYLPRTDFEPDLLSAEGALALLHDMSALGK